MYDTLIRLFNAKFIFFFKFFLYKGTVEFHCMTQTIRQSTNNDNGFRELFIQTLANIDQIQYSHLFEEFISVFNTIHSKIRRYTKYRSINLAFPPILYMFLKVKSIVNNRTAFAQSFEMSYNQLM